MSPVAGITSGTRVFGLLGWPVRHSLSPLMQTAAFCAAGLDACYLAFEVAPENLEEALRGAASLGFGGLNVTVPHKRRAFELAAQKDKSALLTGAANALVPCIGGWKAYNTDSTGFLGAVKTELGFDPCGSNAVIFGAGGAARAAVAGLVEKGAASVLLAARDPDRALALAAEFAGRTSRVEAVALDRVPGRVKGGDLVVSATPLGLDPLGSWPWAMGEFAPGVVFYDMAYSASSTSLERQAVAAGFRACSGRLMLALQGAEAFRLWTGLEPPLARMVESLETR